MNIPPPPAAISNSEISSFLRCRRSWALRYVWQLARRAEDEPATGNMQLGSRMHLAFQGQAQAPLQQPLTHWVDQVYGAVLLERPDAAEDIEKEHALARVMAEGYEEWAAETGVEEGFELVSAEQDVQVPLPGVPGIMLRGKLDRIVRRVLDGVLLFWDWKTTGSLAMADGLAIAPQPRFYTMLQRLSTEDNDARVDGGKFVYLLRSKRTARATPPFYAAHTITYNRHTMNATFQRARKVTSEILIARNRLMLGDDHQDVVPPTPTFSCSWDCAFYAMCPMMDDGSRWADMATFEYEQRDPYDYYDREVPDA